LATPENWGKWGPDDQVGTLNYITPDVICHAASLVRQGKVFNLGLPIAEGHPCGTARDGRIYRYMMSTAQGAGKSPGLAEDHLFGEVHGNTHWDGLAHYHADGLMYNGFDAEEWVDWHGAQRDGIHHAADKVVTRGVLVDIAAYKGVDILEAHTLITVPDMEGAAERQGVSFRSGDMILIYTGWMRTWYEQGKRVFWEGSPGIGWEVSQWLKKKQAAAITMDAINIEVGPPEPEAQEAVGIPGCGLPIHVELIRNQGMMMGDNGNLEELAMDCREDGVYECLFVGPPLNLINGTGSPINPQAIK
jgi:kynurenine formamidase